MKAPKETIRTTLGEFLTNPIDRLIGVYVIACCPNPGVLYVGKSNWNIYERIRNSLGKSQHPLYNFLVGAIADMSGFRLDILVPPDGVDVGKWLFEVERKLAQKFSPLCNVRYLINRNYEKTK